MFKYFWIIALVTFLALYTWRMRLAILEYMHEGVFGSIYEFMDFLDSKHEALCILTCVIFGALVILLLVLTIMSMVQFYGGDI